MKSVFYLALIITVGFLTGCGSTPRLNRIGRDNWVKYMAKAAITTGDMSFRTREFLVENALDENFADDPEKVIELLAKHIDKPDYKVIPDYGENRPALEALIELSMLYARECSEKKAIKYWTTCCFYSYRYLLDKNIKPQLRSSLLGAVAIVRFYNVSASEIFSYITRNHMIFAGKPELPFVLGTIKITSIFSDLLWDPDSFKEYDVCFDYIPENLRSHSYVSGLGVPVVAVKDQHVKLQESRELAVLTKVYPFTFIIEFSSFKPSETGVIDASAEFYDSFKDETFKIGHYNIPLAKDFSVTFARFSEMKKHISGIDFMFNSDKMGELQGLYMITPYQPEKIPVVLIHGLMSEPRTWTELLNTLFSCHLIRENYQFWLYTYPTGQPIIYSGTQLRNSLSAMREKYDPKGENPYFNNMVLVGHSMGGLLSRLVVQDSDGREFMNRIIKENLDDVKLTEKEKKFLEELLVFKPLPFINLVVFISTPHRGSEMATWSISQLGSRLITLPQRATTKIKIIARKIAARDAHSKLANYEVPTGIDNLAPDNPFIQNINTLKMSDEIKYHSIMGDNVNAGNIGGTDGVVPYKSSHLGPKTAEIRSELVVKSDHSAHKKSAAIKEIRRILLKHLVEFKISRESQNKK